MAKDVSKLNEVILIKGTEKFIIRYNSGNEEEAINHVRKMHSNPDINFDKYDAYCLEISIRRNMDENKLPLY